jgi:hypothetical protein
MNQTAALEMAGERAQRINHPADRRLARMRFLSQLLDNAIALPGGYRIGLDPIIGLIPAVGDFLSATLSVWLIYDAARLGISRRTLALMGFNVLLDSTVGSVPVVGDVMDAFWKSNARNMRLVEAEYHPAMKPRSFGRIGLTLLLVLVSMYGVIFAALYFVIRGFLVLFGW